MLRAMVFHNFVHFEDKHLLNFREGNGATYFIGASSTGKTAVLELIRRCMCSTLNSSLTNRFNEEEHGYVFCQFARDGTEKNVILGIIVEGEGNKQSMEEIEGGGEENKSELLPGGGKEDDMRNDDTSEDVEEDSEKKDERKERKGDVKFHKIVIYHSSDGILRIRSTLFFHRKEKNIDSSQDVEVGDDIGLHIDKIEEQLFKDKSDANEFVKKVLKAIKKEQPNKVSYDHHQNMWDQISEQFVGILSMRGPGTFQWTKSNTILEENKEYNYNAASEQAEVITKLLDADEVDKDKEREIFNALTYPDVFEFRKVSEGKIVVEKSGGRVFPLLKTSLGIVEAKQFALLISHKAFRTICLEEPERGMHPQMIERMKTILHRECDRKTVIVVTHSPAFIDSVSIERSYLFTRKKQVSSRSVCGVNNIKRTQFGKLMKVSEIEELKKIFFATKVLLVEGMSDKIVIQAIFGHILENCTDKEKMKNINSYQIIVLDGCLRIKPIQDLCKDINLPFAAVLDRDTCIEVDGRGCVDAIHKKYYKYTEEQPINIFLGEPFKTLSDKLQKEENLFIWKDGDIEDFLLSERDKRDKILEILDLGDKKSKPRKEMKRSIKDKLKIGISQEQSSKLGEHLNEYEEVSRLCEFLSK
ncbi:uncharacterized protein LOC125655421 [Ostrea edulis]|uniref:uncharacterized protein LOC125655421 n=1 Tax=Ostrea edulis TaxID=37623 RepID=UPI0024AF268E|nr:uncharacterized protein LOC125655421 [Ostrea edulis]XP_056000044.1 uncharacterized protein LOC125655421 [Ostrea edulis]XP_056000045.1 uncharacterized protein LOC125655421 [Ostrea edulis]XP_056000046.1 uncharacterized protein LOC125655421 [Ostrea edulis]XP_056000047.1 uncharacterized protein LOC125655421 [Ostrea edulis]XP_056000048.1 uncharacterized protein LOC125655421 [Ostrea edulis]